MTEKDIHKLEKSCRKMEESLIKADREYRDSNLKTEEARLSWEAAMYKCCQVRKSHDVWMWVYEWGGAEYYECVY